MALVVGLKVLAPRLEEGLLSLLSTYADINGLEIVNKRMTDS